MPRDITAPTKLAHVMNERRVELRMRWDEIATAAKITTAHLRKFRSGEAGVSDLTKARLEDALGWQPGSVDALLAGGNPTPAQGGPQPPTRRSKTLGDILVERGLRTPDELTKSDDIVDPLVRELLERPSFDDAFKDKWLSDYSTMRRKVFGFLDEKGEPRDL